MCDFKKKLKSVGVKKRNVTLAKVTKLIQIKNERVN